MASGDPDRTHFTVEGERVDVAIYTGGYDDVVELSSRGETVEATVDDRIAHALGSDIPAWAVIALRRLGVADVVGTAVDVPPGRGRA